MSDGTDSGTATADPRKILGEYPEQSREIIPPADEAGEIWTDDIDTYPLREKSEDPRWAVSTVWVWVGFTLGCMAFVTWLLVMGLFHD